jgi:hypothetical protein
MGIVIEVRDLRRMPKQAQRSGDVGSGSVALRAVLEVLGDDFAGGVFATAAAGPDGELALHFKQGAGAVIHGITDLTITHCVADAYVHFSPSLMGEY